MVTDVSVWLREQKSDKGLKNRILVHFKENSGHSAKRREEGLQTLNV